MFVTTSVPIIFMWKWYPKILKGEVCLQGFVEDSSGKYQSIYRTSAVIFAINGTTVLTKSGSKYVLLGKLNKKAALKHGLPPIITTKFQDGFPETWRSILRLYLNDQTYISENFNDISMAQRTRSGREVKPTKRYLNSYVFHVDAPNVTKRNCSKQDVSESKLVLRDSVTLEKQLQRIKRKTSVITCITKDETLFTNQIKTTTKEKSPKSLTKPACNRKRVQADVYPIKSCSVLLNRIKLDLKLNSSVNCNSLKDAISDVCVKKKISLAKPACSRKRVEVDFYPIKSCSVLINQIKPDLKLNSSINCNSLKDAVSDACVKTKPACKRKRVQADIYPSKSCSVLINQIKPDLKLNSLKDAFLDSCVKTKTSSSISKTQAISRTKWALKKGQRSKKTMVTCDKSFESTLSLDKPTVVNTPDCSRVKRPSSRTETVDDSKPSAKFKSLSKKQKVKQSPSTPVVSRFKRAKTPLIKNKECKARGDDVLFSPLAGKGTMKRMKQERERLDLFLKTQNGNPMPMTPDKAKIDLGVNFLEVKTPELTGGGEWQETPGNRFNFSRKFSPISFKPYLGENSAKKLNDMIVLGEKMHYQSQKLCGKKDRANKGKTLVYSDSPQSSYTVDANFDCIKPFISQLARSSLEEEDEDEKGGFIF